MAYAEGDKCWFVVKGDGGGVYEATVEEVDDETVTCASEVGTYTVPKNGDLTRCEGAGGDEEANVAERDDDFPEEGYDQMTSMRKLSDAELNRNLDVLFHQDRCYCYCGPTLVALNTFKMVPGLFDYENVLKYHGAKMEDNLPHAYAVVEAGYQRMWELYDECHDVSRVNQATVITGESGAGKSFTTNRMLDYLSAIGRPSDDPKPPCFREPPIKVSDLAFDEKSITDKLLTSTAIVEAFGNAKMPRNNDSSRFGKLYRLFFSPDDHFIKGCSIEPYLLEKSRVTSQAQDERNYHIFYELVRGLSEEEKTRFKVHKLSEYNWLNGSVTGIDPTYDIPRKGEAHDIEELVGVRDALSNFCADNAENIFRSTMGVLRMGDIVIGGEQTAELSEEDEALNEVAALFEVDCAALKDAITCQTINIMKVDKKLAVSRVTAVKFNGSIAKAVYNKQFEWMVAQCSKDLVKEVPQNIAGAYTLPFIGVLDIFGFEFVKDEKLLTPGTVDKNSFEQCCINGCNEKLQQLFVDIVIDLETALYKKELDFAVPLGGDIRNDSTVDLIFGSKKSVYSQIENVSKVAARSSDPNANFDDKFLDDVKAQCGKNPRMDIKAKVLMQYAKKRCPARGFIVKHYAADVLYDPDGWVDKNQDKITTDMKICLANSQQAASDGAGSGCLPGIFKDLIEDEGKGPGSVLAQFKRSLDVLCDTLLHCDTGFVRCIKPNRVKEPDIYEADLVLTQLAYTGMLVTLKIQKAGFPVRFKHQRYLDDFRCLDPDAATEGVEALVKSINENRMPGIIEELSPPPPEDQKEHDAIIVGKVDLVLSRDWAHTQVEIQAKQVKGESAVIIQSAYRANEYSKEFAAKQAATLELGSMFRGTLGRLEYYPQKYAQLEVMSRSSMTRAIKAALARKQYYKERAEFFYDINKRNLQTYIQATVYRQWFYERKLAYCEIENILKEREKFSKMDAYAEDYMEDWAHEIQEEIDEIEGMMVEEEYRQAWVEAKEAEVYDQQKETCVMDAEGNYRKAAVAVRGVLDSIADALKKQQLLEDNANRIEKVATAKSREVLIRMGVIRESNSKLFAPKLPPTPGSHNSGDNWEQETTGAISLDDHEGLENYFKNMKLKHRGGNPTTSIELDSNVDVTTLQGRTKQEFVANVAKAMGIEPKQVKVVLDMETPRC